MDSSPLPASFIPQMRRQGQMTGGDFSLALRLRQSYPGPRENRAATMDYGSRAKRIRLRGVSNGLPAYLGMELLSRRRNLFSVRRRHARCAAGAKQPTDHIPRALRATFRSCERAPTPATRPLRQAPVLLGVTSII